MVLNGLLSRTKCSIIAQRGWNAFRVDVRAEGNEFVIHQNNSTVGEFHQNEDTISIYLDWKIVSPGLVGNKVYEG